MGNNGRILAYSQMMERFFNQILTLILWLTAGLSFAFLANEYLAAPGSLYFISMVIVLGAFTFFKRPFFRNSFSLSIDLGVTIVSSVIVLIYLASLVVQPSLDQEQSLEVCGSQTKEKKCYSLPKLVCQNMWEKYEGECIKEIKKDIGDRVTALIGPPIKKCTQRRFDKSLYYTRNSKDPDCLTFFQSLKE